VEWGEAAGATLGAPVLALANPGGRGLRATAGFVSASERSVRGPRGRRVRGAIEHTAPLPRGSSGGPLLDAAGRLVGLNAVRVEGGLILAVPVGSELRERVERVARGESQEPRRLGVALAPPRVARRMRRAVGLPERDGLLVRAVEQGSPADRAGVERGDLLVAAAGRELDGMDALYGALEAADGSLALTVVRGVDERELEVLFEEAER
jgi:serine protease Do